MNARLEGADAEHLSSDQVVGVIIDAVPQLTLDHMLELHFGGMSYAEIGGWFGIDADLTFQIVREALRHRYEED